MRLRLFLVLAFVSMLGWAPGCSEQESDMAQAPVKIVRKIPREAPEGLEGKAPVSPAPAVAEKASHVEPVPEPPDPAPEPGGVAPAPEKPAAVQVRIPAAPPPDPGTYVVKKGDSLAVIAGREDVFGDPLKWVLLFQMNREKLQESPLDERLPERILPKGMRLRFALSEEDKARAAGNGEWVINLISSPTEDRIDGPSAVLLRNGYPIYISRTTVKGVKWMRLRVGFFKSKTAAMEVGKELQDLLKLEDIWPVRIGPEEKAEYADFLVPAGHGGRG